MTTRQTSASPAGAALDRLAAHKTALLTTYKRNGDGVDTPVTVAVEGDRAFFRSYDKAWKTKRLGNNPELRIAPSTVLGRPLAPALSGSARLLEGEDAARAARAIAARAPVLQGLMVPLFHRLKRYRTMHYELIR